MTAPTGTGESTPLLSLAKASIDAGRSLVVIDPKGGLAHDLLSVVPEHRMGHVVVLDPTTDYPVGIDLLHGEGIEPSLATDGMLSVFKGLFPRAFGLRTSDTLHASLLTLSMTPGTTLADLPRLLTDPSFRDRLTAEIDEATGLGECWEQYNTMKPPQQAAWIGPVSSRLRQFMLRRGLSATLSQSNPRFEIYDVLTKSRILIVSLNRGILGQREALTK